MYCHLKSYSVQQNHETSWNHNILFSVSLSVSFCMFPCSKGHFIRAYLDTIQMTLGEHNILGEIKQNSKYLSKYYLTILPLFLVMTELCKSTKSWSTCRLEFSIMCIAYIYCMEAITTRSWILTKHKGKTFWKKTPWKFLSDLQKVGLKCTNCKRYM